MPFFNAALAVGADLENLSSFLITGLIHLTLSSFMFFAILILIN